MDGLTAVREIREAERAGTLSPQMVIALTGNARQGQIDQAMEAGMDDGESIAVHQTSLTISRYQAIRLVPATEEDQGHVCQKGGSGSIGRGRVILHVIVYFRLLYH